MFVGHLAVALGAKRVEPRLSLAALTMATFGLDVLWPIFLLAGVETVEIHPGDTAFTPLNFTHYPWSHSLLMSVVWGALGGAIAAKWLGSARAGFLIGVLVVSHWVLDFVTHRPDLPLWPGGPMEGLGLWNSITGTLVVEGALLALGLAIYLRSTRARDALGVWPFWLLVAVVTTAWLTGPKNVPPDIRPLAIASIFITLVMLAWTMWIERHRTSR